MRVAVDVGGLVELARSVGLIHARLLEGTAAVPAAMASAPARSAAGPLLSVATAARDRSMSELAALRIVVSLAAECYAASESRVAELVASCPVLAVGNLLTAADPAALEHLLVTSPALTALVTAQGRGGADWRLVDELTHTLLLPVATRVRAQARLFGAMDAGERRRFALVHPRLVTSMAAAPTSDRFAASRVLVAADLADLLRRRALLAPGLDRDLQDRRITLRQRLLEGRVMLRHPDGTATTHPHQLLTFDPAGDGRIVEVIGDLGRARHLAVFVPGTGSDLDRYAGSFNRMTPFAAADPSLAVVLWQNADHPDRPFDDPLTMPTPSDLERQPDALQQYVREHVLAAAFRDAADVGGPVLAADVTGLRVAAPGAGRDVTVLGHSYGGSIVGSAEAHGMVADRVVHVASAGAYVDDVRDYADPASTRRFSMTAYDDPIRLSQGHDAADASARLRVMLPAALDPLTPLVAEVAVRAVGRGELGHGLDPDLMPDVVRLDTGVHADGTLVRGHSGMFAPDSTAWRGLLGVMTKGQVSVLQPQLWSSHLDPLGVQVRLPGGAVAGRTTMRLVPPHYVVDHSPYDDPAYRAPVLDLG